MLKISFDRIEEALEDDGYVGFCLACGEDAYNVEPDACKYLCESCGERAVYGASEVLLMGQIEEDDIHG